MSLAQNLKQAVSNSLGRNLTLNLFKSLKALGFSPSHIIDIGANRGKWTRQAAAQFPNARISLFEPQKRLSSDHADLAANPKIDLHYKGVGDVDGLAAFTIHNRDDSSSFLYASDEADARGFEQSEVEIIRLDSFMAQSGLPSPNMVKIDAEGLDLKVIEGGRDTLQKADVVLIEAALANKDYPNTVIEVMTRMAELGFRPFDITDLNRTPRLGLLWLIEIVFVRAGSQLDLQGSHYD